MDPEEQDAATGVTTRSQTALLLKRSREEDETNLETKRAKSPLPSNAQTNGDSTSDAMATAGTSNNGTLHSQVSITVSNEYDILQEEGDDDDDDMPLLTPGVPNKKLRPRGTTLAGRRKKFVSLRLQC